MAELTDEVRECLAQVGEALDDGLLLVDQQGQIHLSNRTARTLLNLHADRLDVVGGGAWQAELLSLLRRLPAEGAATELHTSGTVPLVLEAYALEQKGEFWGGIFVARSAAGRQRELDTSRAAEFARDVKNALHSLLLNLYILRKWAASQPFVETQTLAKFDLISNEIHRLNGTAEDFLPDTRPLRIQRDAIRLPQLLTDIAAMAMTQARDARVEIRCRVPDELPPILGDARLLKEAFVNLILNRLQSIREGGELEIMAGAGGKHAFVMVSDTGTGIPFGLRDQVMSEGFAVRPGAGGRGLGITEWVVRGHGGSFETFSAAGLGTTFVVKLPLSGIPPGMTDEDFGLLRRA